MRVLVRKSDEKIVEFQSNATAGTLRKNAQKAGLKLSEHEEREIDGAELQRLKGLAVNKPVVFHAATVKKEIFEGFKADASKLSSLYAPFSDFLSTENFTDLKEYANILISASIITQADYTTIKGILSNHGIDLDNF